MKCAIVMKHGLKKEQILTFKRKEITIGRSFDNDIMINDRSISGHHVKISFHESWVELVDLQSRNGTTLNIEPLQKGALYDQDRFSIGHYTMQFICPEAVSEDAMDQTMLADAGGWSSRDLDQVFRFSGKYFNNIVLKCLKAISSKVPTKPFGRWQLKY